MFYLQISVPDLSDVLPHVSVSDVSDFDSVLPDSFLLNSTTTNDTPVTSKSSFLTISSTFFFNNVKFVS